MNMDRKKIWLVAIALVAVLVGIIIYGRRTDQNFLSALAGAIIPIVLGWLLPKSKAPESAWTAESGRGRPDKTVDELTARYGEPDNLVLLNPVKGNDAEGVVLVYDGRGMLIVNGEELRKSDVIDVTFCNAAVPYLPNDYQVVLTTRDRQRPEIHLYTGNDVEWTRQAAEEIRGCVGITPNP